MDDLADLLREEKEQKTDEEDSLSKESSLDEFWREVREPTSPS